MDKRRQKERVREKLRVRPKPWPSCSSRATPSGKTTPSKPSGRASFMLFFIPNAIMMVECKIHHYLGDENGELPVGTFDPV